MSAMARNAARRVVADAMARYGAESALARYRRVRHEYSPKRVPQWLEITIRTLEIEVSKKQTEREGGVAGLGDPASDRERNTNGDGNMKTTFRFLVTSLRGDPLTVQVEASSRSTAWLELWKWCERTGIDQGEWETNSYEAHPIDANGEPITRER